MDLMNPSDADWLSPQDETDIDEKIERLKAEARDRWGERWTVRVNYCADGDASAHAFRSRGRTSGGLLKEDRLFLTDEGVAVEQVTQKSREVESEIIEASTD